LGGLGAWYLMAHARKVSTTDYVAHMVSQAVNVAHLTMILNDAGYQINLAPGNYPTELIPNYWEQKRGSASAPVIITTDPALTGRAVIQDAVNMFDCSYIYFINLDIVSRNDPMHLESCDHMLFRKMYVPHHRLLLLLELACLHKLAHGMKCTAGPCPACVQLLLPRLPVC
jgi:hypothetical protein